MFDFTKYYNKLLLLKDQKNSELVHKIRQKILGIVRSERFSSKLHKYLNSMNTNEGHIPFSNFEQDPEPVSQVKKIINALYHAEKALSVLETMDFGYKDAFKIMKQLGPTREHAYQACMLFTHLDIDLADIFADEIAFLTPLFSTLQTYVTNYSDVAKGIISNLDIPDISHRVGTVGGVAVNQMKAEHGVDYEFITQFTSLIPGYIDEFTNYIKKFSSTATDHDKSIDQQRRDELKDHAVKLLKALKGLNSHHYLLPMKVLHFVHIISHTLTLATSIIEQIGLFDKSTQDVIRSEIATLKYQYLPELFVFIDKIEMQIMANPGFLSKPVMTSMSKLYGVLIDYAKKTVDFSENGKELLTMNDSRFLAARLKPTYQRMVNDQKKLLQLKSAEKALSAFFAILDQEEYREKRLVDLPDEAKERLILHFKIMMPLILQFDVRLHDSLIWGLTRKKGNFDRVEKAWHTWIHHSTDCIKDILAKKPTLEARLSKAQQSLKFHNALNMDMIHFVSREVDDLKFSPLFPKERRYCIDEAVIVGGERDRAVQFADLMDGKRVINLESLSTTQALKLYNAYQLKGLQVGQAIKNFNTFFRKLQGSSTANRKNKFGQDWQKTLLNSYNSFRPYLDLSSSKYGPKIKDLLPTMDQAIIDILSNPDGLRPASHVTVLRRIKQAFIRVFKKPEDGLFETDRDELMDAYFSHNALIQRFILESRRHLHSVQEKFTQRSKVLSDVLQRKLAQESTNQPMVTMISQTKRAYHVIKHQEISKAIAKIRLFFERHIKIFNDSVLSQLDQQEQGLPFPELEDINLRLSEPAQVLGPKQLLNALYHLEQASLGLEKLTDDLSKNDYVSIVLEARGHLIEAMSLTKALANNPFLTLMASEVKEQLQKGFALLKTLREHYFPSELELAPAGDSKTKHNAVFYSLNTMMILPVHIALCREGESLSLEKTRAIHRNAEKMVANINQIISHASSYFKLFLDIPNMYSMFGEFKKKLIDLASSASGVVMDNLSAINEDLFTRMLIEADRWEGHFALKPGTLTSTLKQVLDEFYQGLLEPLSFNSKEHLKLIASPAPLQKRYDFASRTKEDAIEEQAIIEEKLQRLEQFLQAIQTVKQKESGVRGKSILFSAYRQAWYILKTEAPHYTEDLGKADAVFTALGEWNPAQGLDDALLTNMKVLGEACFNYLKGRDATQRIIRDTADEKMHFLDDLKRAEVTRIEAYRVKYSKTKFKEQVDLLSAKPVGLMHCMGEYTEKLNAHLMLAEDEVVTVAKSAEDIKLKIEELLSDRAEKFEQEHYKNYFHLERAKEAIERLKIYISGENSRISKKSHLPENKRVTFFEDKDTVAEKSVLISELDAVSTDQKLNVTARLAKLKELVSKPTFATTISAGYSEHTIGFVWFVQCVLSLFECLGLYKPQRKACYKQLLKAIEPPDEPISKLSAQFGLFSGRKSKEGVSIAPPTELNPAQVPLVPAI